MLSLIPATHPALSARMDLDVVRGGDKPLANITVRVSDPSAVEHADWFYAMAWQGKEQHVAYATMKRVGDGVYRSVKPLPVYGTWKTVVRLHKGSVMEALAVSMPADTAIPVAAVPAELRATRPFLSERKLLQRERKPDVPGWLFHGASAAVGLATIMLAFLLGWALVRQARGVAPETRDPDARRREAAREPVAA
jgi:hypothetical protein